MGYFVRTKEQQACFVGIQKQDMERQLLLNVFILWKISPYRAVVNLALVPCLSLCGYCSYKSFCLAERSFALVGFVFLAVSEIRNKQGRKRGTFTIFTSHIKIPNSGENTCPLVEQQKQLAWVCTGGRVHDSGFQELSGSVQSMAVTGCNLLHVGDIFYLSVLLNKAFDHNSFHPGLCWKHVVRLLFGVVKKLYQCLPVRLPAPT